MKRRKLNGKFLSLVCAILLLIISLIKIPAFITHNKLEAMGYSNGAITAILDKGLKKTIYELNDHSDFLDQKIQDEDFELKYLKLYLKRTSLSKDDIFLYERLKEVKGYNDEELLELYVKLDYDKLLPLIVFDKVEDLNAYINDALTNETLKGDYIKEYDEPFLEVDSTDYTCYVSTKTDLKEYEPSKLSPVGSMHSIPGVKLESVTLDNFTQMCMAMRNEDKAMYAVSGYVPYSQQVADWNYYDIAIDALKKGVIKPGFNEEQTGFVVVVRTNAYGASNFDESEEFAWLKLHAHEFGFIFRFPEGKEKVTNYKVVSDTINFPNATLRYVGKDLATKIYDSGLSFDEYFYLYMY